MSSDELPLTVQELLNRHVTTFEQLEVMLLLGGGPGQAWSLQDLRSRVPRSEELSEAIRSLRASGLILTRSSDRGESYLYAPATAEIERAVSSLLLEYRERPMAVMRFMSASSIRRLRRGAARAFADAFLVGKGKDDKNG